MITPKIHLVAFQDRQNAMIFVAVPNESNRWLRTDKSVAAVACPFCHSIAGEPCKRSVAYSDRPTVYAGSTHYLRRSAALRLFGHGYRVNDVVPKDVLTNDVEFSG
ncbi:MAG: hypothetical protein V4614_15005 [Pseudomonadota bacterium]